MRATGYTKFCLKIFGKLYSQYKKEPLEEKNLSLVKANIPMSYEEYYSTALMNTILITMISVIFSLIIFLVAPINLNILFIIIIPSIIFSILASSYLYYPSFLEKMRGKNIDMFLPYAINFISSMAVAGISPSEIFETLSKVSVYGEVQTEAKKITKEIKIMGIDNISALKHAIEVSPSKKFKSFLQGIIGTIQSGSDLHIYLSNIANKYMDDDLVDRKKDLDLLAIIAEILVLAVIAFPILLVIILTVMGFFGGSMELSLTLILLFSFLILPTIYAVFYLLMKSTSVEQLSRIKSHDFKIKEYITDNKKPLLVLFTSVNIIIIIFFMIILFSYLKYVQLDQYVYWDFAFISILLVIAPIGFYNYFKMKTKKEMQERLPDFLNEVGDSLATGMNIFDSLKAAEKGHYGKLSPEIKKMKSQLSWNISIKDILYNFAFRLKSAIVQRIIIVIDKGLIMGGNTPKIFKAAAKEVNQVNQIEYQRKSNMSIYAIVILVCFFVFLAIILILNGTIYSSFLELNNQQVLHTGGAIKLSKVDPMMLQYTLFSFVFVQSIGAGILSGFMMDGKLSSGVRFSFVLGLISIFVFKFIL